MPNRSVDGLNVRFADLSRRKLTWQRIVFFYTLSLLTTSFCCLCCPVPDPNAMPPEDFLGASPTGHKCQTDVWYKNRHIVCLDPFLRLPFNWAVNDSSGYHEFRTLRAAKAYIRG